MLTHVRVCGMHVCERVGERVVEETKGKVPLDRFFLVVVYFVVVVLLRQSHVMWP